MNSPNIQEITEAQFIASVRKIIFVEYDSEELHSEAISQLSDISEHPKGWDLIYRPNKPGIIPEKVIQQVKKWRLDNNKPGFKTEPQ